MPLPSPHFPEVEYQIGLVGLERDDGNEIKVFEKGDKSGSA
jgi:hypothetical protein